MEFAATALFIVLLIEQWIMVRRLLQFIVGFISSIIALVIFTDHMLLVAIMLSIISIVFMRLTKVDHHE